MNKVTQQSVIKGQRGPNVATPPAASVTPTSAVPPAPQAATPPVGAKD